VKPGATHSVVIFNRAGVRFNPRPAVKPGATMPPPALAAPGTAFQSSPGREAGRYGLIASGAPPEIIVSILARP